MSAGYRCLTCNKVKTDARDCIANGHRVDERSASRSWTAPSAFDGGLDDPRWHVPQIARRSDNRWGVFCASCSHHKGDYVNPCVKFQHDDWPPPVLDQSWWLDKSGRDTCPCHSPVVVPLDDTWPKHCGQPMWFRGGVVREFYCDCGYHRPARAERSQRGHRCLIERCQPAVAPRAIPCPKDGTTLTLIDTRDGAPNGAWCPECHTVWAEIDEVSLRDLDALPEAEATCTYYQGCDEPRKSCGYCSTHCLCGGPA